MIVTQRAVFFVAAVVLLWGAPAAAQSRWVSVPHAAFTPQSYASATSDFKLAFDHVYFATGGTVLFAEVPLDDGVTVTGFQCDVGDFSPDSTVYVYLQRGVNSTSTSHINMATASSGAGVSGYQILTDRSIGVPVVNNSTYNYRARVWFYPACDTSCRLYGCYIEVRE